MFVKKSMDEIIDHALQTIVDNTPVNSLSAGGIARSLVESFAYEMGSDPDTVNLYDFAEQILNNGYVSKATDIYLDLIGELFSYPRRTEEVWDEYSQMFVQNPIDDETYRYEITKRIETIASSNEESLRLAILSTPGVQDIIGKEYAYGTGSFQFMIIPMYGYDEETVKDSVMASITNVKAFGNKPGVVLPKNVPLDLSIQLVYQESSTATDQSQIPFDVQAKLMDYFGNFGLGQGFIYNDLVQQIMNVSEKIVDFKINSFYMNNEPVLLTNQTVMEDERIRPSTIEVI